MNANRLFELMKIIPGERMVEIVKLADSAIQMLLLEIEEGDSSEEYKALTPEENEFFWIAIQDAVSDSTAE